MDNERQIDNRPGDAACDTICLACLIGALMLTFSLSVLAMFSYV